MLLSIVEESTDWLVVDKPAGLVCHPTKADETSSLIGRVRLHLGHAEGRLVNRLDRETSGLVLIAKHRQAARDLGRLFADTAVEKVYLAIVHGRLPDDPFAIAAPLGKDVRSVVAIKDAVRDDGAVAETFVRRISVLERGDGLFSVAEVLPRSGRKHQIRIHLAHAGYPIVGDKIYGGDETRYLRFVVGALTAEDRRALLLPHHALHAMRLVCRLDGADRMWTAREPERLRAFRDGIAADEAWAATGDEVSPALGSAPT
jgi:23S rRNA pseudouridine1911/1915/1917 synthase